MDADRIVRLWLDNDEGLNAFLVGLAAQRHLTASERGDFLKQEIETVVGLETDDGTHLNPIAQDLLTHALASVDWTKIIQDAEES